MWKKISINLYCKACRRYELHNQPETARNAFNVLSADTARANNCGSALGMIQYYHSIFDISGRVGHASI